MRVLTVVGARPQFIKAAVVSRALRKSHREILLHTGQHFDADMSDVFFEELAIPAPDINLDVGSGTHAAQTAEMMVGIENAILEQKPDAVLVYGDTNSTLAGGLAAAKLNVPVVHVEAGLRSFNRRMPEEVNRLVVDHLSACLLCPSDVAVTNLAREGISRGVVVVGDVMADATAFASRQAATRSAATTRLSLENRGFVLATVHRADNTDDPERLARILRGFAAAGLPVVLPLHPRTRKAIENHRLQPASNVRIVSPVGHLDMIQLTGSAAVVATDSGGLQKEAYWLGTPCVTLRGETEWVETVEAGWNVLVDADETRIADALRDFRPSTPRPALYGDGSAAAKCVVAIEQLLS